MSGKSVENKKTDSKGSKVQLHLGCGERYLSDFIHIDARSFPHVDYVTQVDKLPMFKDESVDLIYSSHLLEHFRRQETERVLSEWYRVLKKGGLLRIAVPDFEKIVEMYSRTKDIQLVLGLLHGRQDYPENAHHVSFDFISLSAILRKVGFQQVRRWDWRQVFPPGYDDFSQAYLPHMDKEGGTLMSLNVEALK